MTDSTLEKVINGLECCLANGHNKCPYKSTDEGIDKVTTCTTYLMQDVLALLKAKQPRVMTLEEVNALDWDYCYLEQERLPGNEYRGMLGKYIMTCGTWPSITVAKISQGVDSYGKTWRCWTSRPTDEQREAEPWKA